MGEWNRALRTAERILQSDLDGLKDREVEVGYHQYVTKKNPKRKGLELAIQRIRALQEDEEGAPNE